MSSSKGKKNDFLDNKNRWELIPLEILDDIAKVYTKGAEKYDDNSWQNLENGYERYKGALLRHLYASEINPIDEETDCFHLAQVAWNAIAMLWLYKHAKEKENQDLKKEINKYFYTYQNVEGTTVQ